MPRARLMSALLITGMACSTTQPAETKKSAAAPDAAQPVVETPDAGVPLKHEAPSGGVVTDPGPGLAEGASLSYDARGAFGPFLITHVDVFPDGTARCFRRGRVMEPAQRVTITLNDAQRANLATALQQDNPGQARAVRRQGMVMDVGTTTVSALVEGRAVTLVVDGRNVVDPPIGNLMLQLGSLSETCLKAGREGVQ